MTTEIISTETEFLQLKNEWTNLHRSSRNQRPFLTGEWMYQWWISYREKISPNPQLSIILTRDNDNKLQTIWPFFIWTENSSIGKLKILGFLGTLIESSDYLDIIADRNIEESTFRETINSSTFIKVTKSVDKIIFKNVLDDSVVFKYGPGLNYLQWQRRNAICPFLILPQEKEELLNSLSKNMKSSLRRTYNKLQKDPDTKVRTVTNTNDINLAVENLFNLHGARFNDKEEDTNFVFLKRGVFHQQVAKTFLEKDWLRFYEILYKDEVIGSLYCYLFCGRLMYFQAGFNPQFSQFALGNQLILYAITDAIDLKCIEFDFMRGDEAYKYKWTSSERNLYTFEFGCSTKGRFQVAKKNVLKIIKKFLNKE